MGCLPSNRPFAFATFMPSRVRSRMRSASNSATIASTGEPTFKDSTDVPVEEVRDLDLAGFVRVMTGLTTDPDRSKQLMAEMRTLRPDIQCSVFVGHEDGIWTTVTTSSQRLRP